MQPKHPGTLPASRCACNSGGVTVKPSALSVWLSLPEADRDAWNNFRRSAAALINHVDANLQQHFGLGYTDVDALLHLSVADGNRLRMVELARAVSRSPSALTRLVDRLQRRSLVVRIRHSATDVSVEITPAGLDLLADAAPQCRDEIEQRFWTRLTATERDTLSRICQKLLDTEPTNS